ncbi:MULTISPECIES: hypothetical protein [unclassified Sphingomonas]|uniref:hypothetical protein n=1 Tax=unclassified Sphingomonas TaxID=196159 RepID=UPI0006FFA592|nr:MULTISPECIES: hypothetical protein [unclassified Sphingomonas]KQX25559.1 hypothetical protein ASD17_22585 [Sphingomonas sp. Root1294]KQY66549.1 hypothetical protein ASD39_12385 [Sphingomonas sp. Root50]KRB90129.1 hypothetical protein ASE22_14565 [Sphingomonas sp. Root720]
MALVSSNDIAFEFPVQIIEGDGERWTCRKLNDLTRVIPARAKRGAYSDMQIIDASQRRWIVRSFRKIERIEYSELTGFALPNWRVEYMLEELPPVPPRVRPACRPRKSRTPLPLRDRKPSSVGKTIKASETDFIFPLAGFTDKEGALLFDSLAGLTHCPPDHVRRETLIGMELVDNHERRWIVRSLILARPLAKKRWWQLFTPAAEFDLELEEIDPIGLAEFKSRLIADWEPDSPDEGDAIWAAPDLATMMKDTYRQATSLF